MCGRCRLNAGHRALRDEGYGRAVHLGAVNALHGELDTRIETRQARQLNVLCALIANLHVRWSANSSWLSVNKARSVYVPAKARESQTFHPAEKRLPARLRFPGTRSRRL